jgi:hypothetical protein
VIKLFTASKITLTGVRRANADDMHLDVWDHVETYTIGTTPHALAENHFFS